MTVQDDNTDNINVNNIRTYKDFVKSNNSVTRNRVYNKPEMGVGISGNGKSNPNLTNKVEGRRYYSNPNSVNELRGSKTNDWGLGGRNIRTNAGSSTRTYSNPSSSLPSYNNSNSSRSYSSPSSSNRSFSRTTTSGSSSSSSSSSNSSVGGSRGSR